MTHGQHQQNYLVNNWSLNLHLGKIIKLTSSLSNILRCEKKTLLYQSKILLYLIHLSQFNTTLSVDEYQIQPFRSDHAYTASYRMCLPAMISVSNCVFWTWMIHFYHCLSLNRPLSPDVFQKTTLFVIVFARLSPCQLFLLCCLLSCLFFFHPLPFLFFFSSLFHPLFFLICFSSSLLLCLSVIPVDPSFSKRSI